MVTKKADTTVFSLRWKEQKKTLAIGGADHIFAQSLKGRTCHVILEGSGQMKSFVYEGKEIQIEF